MERALNTEELLVGVTGKDALRDAFDDIIRKGEGPAVHEEAYNFMERFGEIRGLRDKAIDPVIDLLEAGGVARNRAAREIMRHMVTIMQTKIKTLNQHQLDVLLDRSYSYLTVPELAPVAITTLECMRNVRPGLWTEIVQNGLDESPYTDLPITLKRRIWAQELSAFEFEVEALIDNVPELQAPTLDALMLLQPFEIRRLHNKNLKDLQALIHQMPGQNLIAAAEKLIEKANSAPALPKKMAIGNLFHDFIQGVPIRDGNILQHAKQFAREADKTQTLTYDQGILQAVRDSLQAMTNNPLIVLLYTSTYSRDFVAECLVKRLRKLAEKLRTVDEQHRPAALKELVRDTDLQNLTFICMFTMKLSALQTGDDIVQETETELPTAVFYPLIITEMANDQRWTQDEYHRENAELPHADLLECVTNGRLERRVLSTYCRYLLQQNITVCLRRFHFILDSMIPLCDVVEEVREVTLARGICELLSIKKK